MRIIVSGGKGFIGGYLVKELKKDGHKVDVYTGDVTDREKTMDAVSKYDMVYHLAGVLGTSELIDQAFNATKVNVLGTINILDGAVKNKTKVVHVTKPNVWLNTYSITKEAGEQFAKMYHEQLGLHTISVKWFNVYGPGQSFHCQKAVPFFIRWALKNEDIEIWGDGQQTMDLQHAHDAVRATILLAGHKDLEGKTVDVGTGYQTSVNDLADMIKNIAGSESKIVHLPMRPGETRGTKLSADMTILNSYGFQNKVKLEDGMKETIEWYKSQPAS